MCTCDGFLESEAKISDEVFSLRQSKTSLEVVRSQFKSLISLFVFSIDDSLEKAQLDKLDPDWAIALSNNPEIKRVLNFTITFIKTNLYLWIEETKFDIRR